MADTQQPARAEILRTRDFLGWNVTDSGGAKVGTVSDLLIDRQGRLRYLAVDPGLFRKPVLLPVDALDWGESALVASAWSADEVRAFPPYDPDTPLSEAVLEELERSFPRYYRPGGPPPPRAEGDAPRTVPLREAAKDFKLAKGAPDLRGWSVFASDHERVGAVADMLVDPVAMKVRYLSVDLADDLFLLSDDRHVLIPLEAVELRERGEDVWVKHLSARDLARLPAYTGGAVDPLLEEASRSAFGAGDRPPVLVHADAPPPPPEAAEAPPPEPMAGPSPEPPLPPEPPLAPDAPPSAGAANMPPPFPPDAGEKPPVIVHDAGPGGPEGRLEPPPPPPGDEPPPGRTPPPLP
jgi:sporulation protein YlmC with PRC-barrel domain